MKIHSNNQLHPLLPGHLPVKKDAVRTISHDATLQLSFTGRLLLDAHRALEALPALRTECVNHLAGRLQSGRYTVNSDTVAAAMLDTSVAAADRSEIQ